MDKKVVLQNEYEDVIEDKDHFYIISKKDLIGVIPYTIATDGIIDKVGVVKDLNIVDNKLEFSVLHKYANTDEETDLISASNLLYSVTGLKIKDASKWMYIGSMFYSIASDSPIRLYCVDMTGLNVNDTSSFEDVADRKKFNFIDIEKAISSEDMLLIAAYFRIFNLFYIQNINDHE